MTSGQGVDLTKLDPAVASQLSGFLNPQMLLDQPKLKELHNTLPADVQPLFTQMIAMLRSVLSDSLTVVFLFGTALLVLAFLLVLFLKEIPLRTSNDVKKSSLKTKR